MTARSHRARPEICSVLRRHLGQRTVLGVAIPVLAGHIDSGKKGRPFRGLTEKQIEAGFRDLCRQFIRSDYHSTYLHRALGPRGFLESSASRYRLQEALIRNVRVENLDELHSDLIASLRSARERREAVMKRIEELCSLPEACIDERHALVDTYLSQIAGNQGEMFEVVSFAILQEYFRTFGFSLQRFSTTHANDGGMDFVGGEAIYQVTTDESAQKLRKDLAKSPGTRRVLVRPTATPEIVRLCDDEVLEVIDLKDLLSHFISWLLQRDKRVNRAKHLQQVLRTSLEQFRRENRAECA